MHGFGKVRKKSENKAKNMRTFKNARKNEKNKCEQHAKKKRKQMRKNGKKATTAQAVENVRKKRKQRVKTTVNKREKSENTCESAKAD